MPKIIAWYKNIRGQKKIWHKGINFLCDICAHLENTQLSYNGRRTTLVRICRKEPNLILGVVMFAHTMSQNREFGNMTNSWAKDARKKLVIAFGGCCQFILDNGEMCGSIENLEFSHLEETGVTGWGRGRNKRVFDIIKYPWKYNLFCKDCHTIFDHTT